MAVEVLVRFDRFMQSIVVMLLTYGSLIGELVISMIMTGPFVFPSVLIRLPRIRGTVTAEWLRFLDLSCLLRLMIVSIVLMSLPLVSVIVLLMSMWLVPFRWLQFRLQLVSMRFLVPPILLRTPLLPAVPIPEELEFRQCVAVVTLLTIVMWALVPNGRAVPLPPNSISEFLVIPCVMLRRVVVTLLPSRLPCLILISPAVVVTPVILVVCVPTLVLDRAFVPIVFLSLCMEAKFGDGTLSDLFVPIVVIVEPDLF